MRILKRYDILAGLLFGGMALATIWISLGYPLGTPGQMGAGFFPLMLGGALLVLSVLLLAGGLRHRADDRDRNVEVETQELRGLVTTLGAVLLFAVLVEPLGLVVSILALTFVSALGSPSFRLVRALTLGGCLAAFCYCIFVLGLGLRIPVWPNLSGGL